MTLPVTITFLAIVAVAVTLMTAWIGLYRGKANILHGAGDNQTLYKRSRMHGNFVENAPIMVMTLAAAESLGLGQGWLWAAVVSFLIGRGLYFVLFDNKMRGAAMSLTQFPAAFLALWSVIAIYSAG